MRDTAVVGALKNYRRIARFASAFRIPLELLNDPDWHHNAAAHYPPLRHAQLILCGHRAYVRVMVAILAGALRIAQDNSNLFDRIIPTGTPFA
jgi:L-alanine-DL-glutamate epimerase-like enolase superfamily enzyme